MHGIAGAIVATVSIFLPSFLMVVGVVPYFDRLRASDRFNRCMSGILASFVGLLLSVTIQFGLDVAWNVPRIGSRCRNGCIASSGGRSLGGSRGGCTLDDDVVAMRWRTP